MDFYHINAYTSVSIIFSTNSVDGNNILFKLFGLYGTLSLHLLGLPCRHFRYFYFVGFEILKLLKVINRTIN